MITNISLITLWVTDQDAARDFYVDKLGFQARTDVTMGDGFRWVTMSHPEQPELEVTLMVPVPPLDPEMATAVERSLAKGQMGGFGLSTDDCQKAYDDLTASAEDLGYSLVPARVVGWGPAQSFSSTVTIDAGTDAGVQPDMTVVSGTGLVGRVVSAGRTSATVLLIIDPDSTVGARVGDTMDMGFLRGRGVVGDEGRLDLELVDRTAVPARDDAVVTWGSDGGAPYVSGVPIGRVTKVYSSLRETSQRVVVDPYVDFGALDVVGVVVPTGTSSDRALVGPDGELGQR